MSASTDHPEFLLVLMNHLVRVFNTIVDQTAGVLEAAVGARPQRRQDVERVVRRAQALLEWAQQASQRPAFAVRTGDIEHGIRLGPHVLVTRELVAQRRVWYHVVIDDRPPTTEWPLSSAGLIFRWESRQETLAVVANALATELLRMVSSGSTLDN